MILNSNKMTINSNIALHFNSSFTPARQEANTRNLMYLDENREENHEIEADDDDNDFNHMYLTVDLSTDIVNKIKTLSTNELEQMKQIGILTVQFENDPFKLNIPSIEAPLNLRQQKIKPMVTFMRKELETKTLANLAVQSNDVAKKRSRKTISELTSGAFIFENKEHASTGNENSDMKKNPRNKRNSKELDTNHSMHSNAPAASSFVSSSLIVDQSPSFAACSTQLSTQFQYLKQFTMPSPTLTNILNNNDLINSGGMISNDKLMGMDDYKQIYQMRQELANQMVTGGKSEASGEEKIKKQRRAPSNSDPNKPKTKRTKQVKPEAIQSEYNINNSEQSVNASQQQLYQPELQNLQHIGNIISNNSNSVTYSSESNKNVADL